MPKTAVPISPELVVILRAHLKEFGTAGNGRLFSGARGEVVPAITYGHVWHRARALAFTPEVCASPLGKTPYALPGSPWACCPAARNRPTRSWSWVALSSSEGVAGAHPHGVEHRGPRRARVQRSNDRVRTSPIICAWPRPRPQVWQNSRPALVGAAGRSPGTSTEHDPVLGGPRRRQPGQRAAQPSDLDVSVVQRVIQRALTRGGAPGPTPAQPASGPAFGDCGTGTCGGASHTPLLRSARRSLSRRQEHQVRRSTRAG